MKLLKYYTGWFAVVLLALVSCKDEPFVENPSGETIIYRMEITNGGLTGGSRYTGVIDEAAKKITFNISAESDIANVKFSGRLSLGANLDQEAYNFLEGNSLSATTLTKVIRIANVENYTDYTVTLNLAEPQSPPLLSKLEVTTPAGTVVAAVIDLTGNEIYLNTPDEEEVTVSSFVIVPARTEYVFSNIANNKLSKSNPGKLSLSFFGLTAEYTIYFDRAPAAGINFGAPIIHDFSVKSTIYPSFTAEITRSSDFDGEYILIVDRNEPKVLKAADILASNTVTATPLKVDHLEVETGVETFAVSSGQLSHGHIYLCNLAGAGQKLRVYYYETPGSNPQKVLEYTNTITRFGDNITVNVDENGNGYVYFVRQDPGDKILRFEITNFTTFSAEPVEITPSINVSYYANYNQVGNLDRYLLSSTTTPIIQVLDKDGAKIYELETVPNAGGADAKKGTDVHVVEYNRGRFLIMTSGKRFAYEPASTLFVYDITEGFDLISSLVTFDANRPEPVFSYTMDAAFSTAPSANTAWAVVNNKLVLYTAAPHCGFALIEFPRNQQ